MRGVYGFVAPRDGDVLCSLAFEPGSLRIQTPTPVEEEFQRLAGFDTEQFALEAKFSLDDLVYVGPLKALINDQQRRLEDMCRITELVVYPWHGDVSGAVKKQARTTSRGILLITPESLEALFVRRGLEIPRLFGRATAIVIDELHTFLDSERGVQLRSLLARLELATGRQVRRIGLSATLGDMELAKSFLRPGGAAEVDLLEARGDGSDLLIQLRGYVSGRRIKPDKNGRRQS